VSEQEPHPIDRLATATVRACFAGALLAIFVLSIQASPLYGYTRTAFLLWGAVTVFPTLISIARLMRNRRS